MNSSTKGQLIAVVIIAIIVVIVAWYLITRQTYYTYPTLTQITYTPTTGTPPYLVFTFAQPLDAGQVTGTTASLQGFTIAQNSPTPASTAQPFVDAIAQKMPFVPTLGTSPTALVTNTLPGGSLPAAPMVITGTGTMRFAVPRKS